MLAAICTVSVNYGYNKNTILYKFSTTYVIDFSNSIHLIIQNLDILAYYFVTFPIFRFVFYNLNDSQKKIKPKQNFTKHNFKKRNEVRTIKSL